MYLRFTITMIYFPVDAEQRANVFYFLSSFYPFFTLSKTAVTVRLLPVISLLLTNTV